MLALDEGSRPRMRCRLGTPPATACVAALELTARAVTVELDDLQNLRRDCRANHQTVVLTNGCFDLLHRGHVKFLADARKHGDVLIVAVNSDDSVRQRKGPDRPLMVLEDRLAVLSALTSVSYVVPFDEPNACAIASKVCPDIYVKGGDYRQSLPPEAEVVRRIGGRYLVLPYTPGVSTSQILSRYLARSCDTSNLGHNPLDPRSA